MRSAIGSITPTNKPYIPSAHRQGPACWWASWGPADQANPPCSTCWQALSLQPLEKSPSTAFRFQMKPRDRGSDWSHKKTICCLNSRLAKTFIMPPDWRFQGMTGPKPRSASRSACSNWDSGKPATSLWETHSTKPSVEGSAKGSTLPWSLSEARRFCW